MKCSFSRRRSELRRTSCFERRSTAASSGGIWIHDPETSASQTVLKIKCCVEEQIAAFWINKKFHAVTFDYCISFFGMIERHFVLQTRTAALCHLHAQPPFLRDRLRSEQ